MELIAALIVAYYVAKGIVNDIGTWIRGGGSPASRRSSGSAGAAGGGRSGRYGLKAYLADMWFDQWKQMRISREQRLIDRAAGLPPKQHRDGMRGWYGRQRDRVQRWWDAGTIRVDDVRQAQAIQDGERLHATRRQRAWDRLTGQTPAAYPDPKEQDGGERQPTPDGEQQPEPARQPSPDAGTKPAADPDPTADSAGSETKPQQGDNQQPVSDRPATQEENMAEVTGLGTALSYAGAQQEAHTRAVADGEGFAAALSANEVSGEAVEAAQRAMELEQQCAAE